MHLHRYICQISTFSNARLAEWSEVSAWRSESRWYRKVRAFKAKECCVALSKQRARVDVERRVEDTGSVPAVAAVPVLATPAPAVYSAPSSDFGLPCFDNIPLALEDGEEYDTGDLATFMATRFRLGHNVCL
jgi:hypothetical protein